MTIDHYTFDMINKYFTVHLTLDKYHYTSCNEYLIRTNQHSLIVAN